MGLLSDSQSSSVWEGADAPTNFIEFPEISALPVALQKKIVEKWLRANERVALYSKLWRVKEIIPFLALFGGQAGIYSTFSSFKKTTIYWVAGDGTKLWKYVGDYDDVQKAYQYSQQHGVIVSPQPVAEPDWIKILSTSGVLTAMTWMARHNPAGIAIPLLVILGLVGIENLGTLLALI